MLAELSTELNVNQDGVRTKVGFALLKICNDFSFLACAGHWQFFLTQALHPLATRSNQSIVCLTIACSDIMSSAHWSHRRQRERMACQMKAKIDRL